MGFSHYPKLDNCCFFAHDEAVPPDKPLVVYRRASSYTRLFYTIATDQPGEMEVAFTLEPACKASEAHCYDAVDARSYKPGDSRLYFVICAGSWMRATYRNTSGQEQSFFRLRLWGSVF